MNSIFKQSDLELLAAKVRNILKNIGYQVDHEGLKELLVSKGLKVSPRGRVLFNDSLIDEFIKVQKSRYKDTSPAKLAPIPEPKREFKAGFGNIASKFYDYKAGEASVALKKDFEDVVKFGHQDNRIGSIGAPLSITDIPVATAPIEAFLILARLTDKYNLGLEPLEPLNVKYIAELGSIFLGKGKEKEIMSPGCHCINPIMRLEHRTASVMIEQAKYNVASLLTSMPTAGGNAPVTIDGAVIQGTAEIVGGLIIYHLINPDAELIGYISSSILDMKFANTSQSSPESVMIDVGVVNLMDYYFGGNTRIGGRTYVSAVKPGLKAVYEKMFKAAAYGRFNGAFSYAGSGVIDNGALLSPEQLVLDMDVGESLSTLTMCQPDDSDIEQIIAEVIDSGNTDFLSHEHTMKHFRNFWDPEIFIRDKGVSSEKEILDQAHAYYREKVDSYTEYEYDEEKIRAGEQILAAAQKEARIQ